MRAAAFGIVFGIVFGAANAYLGLQAAICFSLTMAHDEFVASALKGIGYNTRSMECADVASLRFGKEFGNKAQCNPTYFTVGNLVQFLQGLEEQGLSREEIIDRYVFFTAGACGPCR